MLRKILGMTAALAFSFGGTQTVMAAEEVAEPGTIVVYRADESNKSSRIRFDVHVDDRSLGRIKADDAVVDSGSAGQYTLGKSIGSTEPLVVDVKPGSVHYVYSQVEVKGGRVVVTLQEVEEQVDKVQQPSLDCAI